MLEYGFDLNRDSFTILDAVGDLDKGQGFEMKSTN